MDILIEVFDLGNSILIGGNNDVQSLFYYKLKEKDSRFLEKIDENIHKLFGEILTSSKISNKLEKIRFERKVNLMSKNGIGTD